MTYRHGSIDGMAIVRTIRPWDNGYTGEHTAALESAGTTIHANFADKFIDSVTIPVGTDETSGRMAFYLARTFENNGLKTFTPSESETPGLHDVIDDNRHNFDSAYAAIPEIVRQTEDYNLLASSRGRVLGRTGLVIVTSEPFMLSIAAFQERKYGVPLADQTYEIPQAGVLSVDLELY